MSDDELIRAMLDADPAVAAIAGRLYKKRHANDIVPAEPPHCNECFEGCPKCQPVMFKSA